jgi:hypothetical protein
MHHQAWSRSPEPSEEGGKERGEKQRKNELSVYMKSKERLGRQQWIARRKGGRKKGCDLATYLTKSRIADAGTPCRCEEGREVKNEF